MCEGMCTLQGYRGDSPRDGPPATLDFEAQLMAGVLDGWFEHEARYVVDTSRLKRSPPPAQDGRDAIPPPPQTIEWQHLPTPATRIFQAESDFDYPPLSKTCCGIDPSPLCQQQIP